MTPQKTDAKPQGSIQRPEEVRRLFGAIADRYDVANHLLSGGLDFFWRKRAVGIVKKWAPQQVLDLATGSGDLALALGRCCREIVGADFSEAMLLQAQRKGVKNLVAADALALPFADASFDAVTISFGLRNVRSWSAALAETHRVLRAGGHLLILDFSIPSSALLRTPYRFYLHKMLPVIASVVTKQKDAYRYLADSIELFPNGVEMLAVLVDAGFMQTTCEPLSGGIVTIYTAAA